MTNYIIVYYVTKTISSCHKNRKTSYIMKKINNGNIVRNALRAGGAVGVSLSSSDFCVGGWTVGVLCFHLRPMLERDWKSTHRKGGEGGSERRKMKYS